MEPLIDFSYLQELSGGDHKYLYELLDIFLGTTPDGLKQLEQLINKGKDWDGIYKQAHFLKSSAGIVKIRDMHTQLLNIEQLGRKKEGMPEIREMITKITTTFAEALPVLIAERDKHKKAAGITDTPE
jgi:HPt (histidine-containing phosphotransfer) domain-containing protein